MCVCVCVYAARRPSICRSPLPHDVETAVQKLGVAGEEALYVQIRTRDVRVRRKNMRMPACMQRPRPTGGCVIESRHAPGGRPRCCQRPRPRSSNTRRGRLCTHTHVKLRNGWGEWMGRALYGSRNSARTRHAEARADGAIDEEQPILVGPRAHLPLDHRICRRVHAGDAAAVRLLGRLMISKVIQRPPPVNSLT